MQEDVESKAMQEREEFSPKWNERLPSGSFLSLKDEFVLFGKLSGPTVVIQLFSMLQWTYTTTFLGTNFGTQAMTGFSLANLSGNLMGMSVVIGFLSACDTLQPQAFAQGRYERVGWMSIKCYTVCMILLACLAPIWFRIDEILILLKQPEEPAFLAKRFLSLYCWAFPGLAFIETSARFYRAQNVTVPFMFMQGVTLALHPVWMNLYVRVFDFGFEGAPLAHCSSVYTMSLLIVLFTRHLPQYHHPGTLPRVSSLKDAISELTRWHELWVIVRLGIPGVLSMSEWWFWETICFFSGEFGTTSLAAHSIAYSLIPLCFMVPLGFGSGMTTRVGALLAQKQIPMAKRLGFWACATCMGVVTLVTLGVYFGRHSLFAMFTNDQQVIQLCIQIWPYVCVFIFLDGFMGTASGLIRALSLQSKMSLAVFLCLWVGGLPLIWFFAEKLGEGLVGIWQGMPLIYVALNMALVWAIVRLDWHAYALSIDANFSSTGDGAHTVLPERKLKAKVSDMDMEIE